MRAIMTAVGCILAVIGCAADSPADAAADAAVADTKSDGGDVSVLPDDTLESSDTGPDVSQPEDTEPDLGPELPPGPQLGDPCDDSDPCTDADAYDEALTCKGTPKDCDDELACTGDTCSEGVCANKLSDHFCLGKDSDGVAIECIEDGDAGVLTHPCETCDSSAGAPIFLEIQDGDNCDDGDACTLGDVCFEGDCVGFDSIFCPEKGPCVSALCDPVEGCNYPPTSGPCDDGSLCTKDDVCDGGGCDGAVVTCDDSDICTLDKCTDKKGCVTEPSLICADTDPCTTDICGAGGACSHVENLGACDDGNPCTTGEACDAHVCKGGVPTECDDGTPCTLDFCEAEVGCANHFDDAASCTDGFFCTQDDTCVSGLCLGNKSFCPSCPLPKTTKALKIVGLIFPTDGEPGSGLDVDANPATCAPEGSCSGGVDNALGLLASVMNAPIATSMTAGTLLYVVNLSELTTDGEPFAFSVVDTKLSDTSLLQSCDFINEECSYVASQYSFDPACKAYFGLENATVSGSKFTAGGQGHVMTIAVALGDSLLPLTLINAQVTGNVTFDPVTKEVTSLSGIFAGATPKQQLYDTIAGLNADAFPVDKASVLALIESLLVNDIDLDADGTKDAASAAMRFVTIPADLE